MKVLPLLIKPAVTDLFGYFSPIGCSVNSFKHNIAWHVDADERRETHKREREGWLVPLHLSVSNTLNAPHYRHSVQHKPKVKVLSPLRS